jgi:hypothetical protein
MQHVTLALQSWDSGRSETGVSGHLHFDCMDVNAIMLFCITIVHYWLGSRKHNISDPVERPRGKCPNSALLDLIDSDSAFHVHGLSQR